MHGLGSAPPQFAIEGGGFEIYPRPFREIVPRPSRIDEDNFTAPLPSSSIVELFREADVVVSGSFHCCIFARLAGVPLVAVSGNTPKVQDLLNLMNTPPTESTPHPTQYRFEAGVPKATVLATSIRLASAARGRTPARNLSWFQERAFMNRRPCETPSTTSNSWSRKALFLEAQETAISFDEADQLSHSYDPSAALGRQCELFASTV